MKALHFDESHDDHYGLDLDGAFNDGFKSAADTMGSALVRWAVVLWSVTAFGVGSYVIAHSIFDKFPAFWTDLPRWMF
jgi:hypothetical protein